jgi:hypothetical protein
MTERCPGCGVPMPACCRPECEVAKLKAQAQRDAETIAALRRAVSDLQDALNDAAIDRVSLRADRAPQGAPPKCPACGSEVRSFAEFLSGKRCLDVWHSSEVVK